MLLDPENKYRLNVVAEDSLKYDCKFGGKNPTGMFDVVVGNPPYSIGNEGKGGSAFYHKFGEKALQVADIVAFVTPGTFVNQDKFKSFRGKLNAHGVDTIHFLPLDSFNVSVERPVYWIALKGAVGTVESFTSTPKTKLYKEIIKHAESSHFNTRSGCGDVKIGETIKDISDSSCTYKYITRVKKDGPEIKFCSKEIFRPLKGSKCLAVFSQRSGATPKIFFVEDASTIGYSQNVMAIGVESKTEYDNLVKYMSTPLVKFILSITSEGKNTKKGMPRAHTVGKIRQVPLVDLSRSWSDQEIYDYFGLTPEQIKEVDASTSI